MKEAPILSIKAGCYTILESHDFDELSFARLDCIDIATGNVHLVFVDWPGLTHGHIFVENQDVLGRYRSLWLAAGPVDQPQVRVL